MSSPSVEPFVLEKFVWTDADFVTMGWLDSFIHAIAFRDESDELLFDIDYAFKWQDPAEGETYFKYWLSACTLRFRGVYQLQFALRDALGVTIADVSRTPATEQDAPAGAFHYRIQCVEGDINFASTGYEQFARHAPVFTSEQVFTEQERGGFSFACTTPDI